MTRRPHPHPRSSRAPRRSTAAYAGLRGLLSALADDLATSTPFERLVVVAGFDGNLIGVGRGVPAQEAESFAQALADWRSGGGRDSTPADASPLAALPSLRSPVLVPAPTPNEAFTVVVAVEGAAEHPGLARVSEILRGATPDLLAAAEAHALHVRVAGEPGAEYAHSLLDALPDPVLVIGAGSRIVFSNRRAAELFGQPSDEDRPGHLATTNGSVLQAFLAEAHESATDLPAHPPEIVLLDPRSGAGVPYEVLVTSIDGAEPGGGERVLVLRDVTEHEGAEREPEIQVGRSEAARPRAHVELEGLDEVVQNAAVPIFVTDGAARIRLVNREAARLLEPRPGTPRQSPSIRDLESNHRQLSRFVAELLLHARTRREGRLVLVDPDEAREIPLLAVSTKILDERGEPSAVVTVLCDLSHEAEHRQLTRTTGELVLRNTQLEAQRTVLERAARLKNEFLSTMSHELRTPINAVLGYNALLRDGLFGQLSERQRDALERMRSAAEHLLSLINDVLDLSRIEAGRIDLSPVEIDWPTLLETLSESVRPLAASKALAYANEVDPEVPRMRTDEMRLRQVLLNLLTNAVKFTDRGSVELRVGSVPGSGRVHVDVTDTGIGIDEADFESIFDEFSQVDQSSTREHGGAGLGLAISRRLIRAMGGSLTVTSTPGRGSTFRVELPVAPPPQREEVAESRPVRDVRDMAKRAVG